MSLLRLEQTDLFVFFIKDRGMFTLQIHMNNVSEKLCLSITIGFNKKISLFHREDRKKTMYLTKGLSRYVFMNIKLEHDSIIGKKLARLLDP